MRDAHESPVHSILSRQREALGLELGASEHAFTRRRDKKGGFCGACTTDEWLGFWTDVLRPWNPSPTAPEYRGAISNILREAEQRYAPR
jgi:hypothetical protein